MLKDKEIEQKEQVIERQLQMNRSLVRMLSAQGISAEEIAHQLGIPPEVNQLLSR